MLDRQHGRLVIECDSCGDLYEGDGAEDASPAFFDAFIAGAKQEGYQSRLPGPRRSPFPCILGSLPHR